jgi:hypothetical protein
MAIPEDVKEYSIKNGRIFKDEFYVGHYEPLFYRNRLAMEKEILLTVGRHFEALRNKIFDVYESLKIDDTFIDAIEYYSHSSFTSKEFSQFLAHYLALKDDRLEALHEVIRKVEEVAKGLDQIRGKP